MIVPVIFSLEVESDYDHLAPFLLFQNMAKRYQWPMIAHERYFQDLRTLEAIQGPAWMKHICGLFHFQLPAQEELDSIPQYKVPAVFEEEFIAQFPSQTDAWVHLLQHEYQPFTQLLDDFVDDILAKTQQPIEAFICFFSTASLKAVAKKRNIPILHCEQSPVRPPAYAELYGFIDRTNMYDYGELEERYIRFQNETRSKPAPQMSRKGLLNLFLSPQYQRDIHRIDDEPAYELGILLTHVTRGLHLQFSQMTNSELLLRARRRFKAEDIIERGRPGFSSQGTDSSPTMFHFACKCKRIVANASNGIFEAMLAGRTACNYGHAYHAFMAEHGVEEGADRIAPLDFINFVMFGYFLPIEWMTDVDYLRFRLGNPSELAIYMRGYEYAKQKINPLCLSCYEAGKPFAYTLGTPLFFTASGQYSAYLYFTKGLSVPEGDFIWSLGDETAAMFQIEQEHQDLRVRFTIAAVFMGGRTSQLVSLYANDSYIGTVELTAGTKHFEFIIPSGICHEPMLSILLRYANPQQPNGDARLLTAAYTEAVVEACDSSASPMN